jgi:hypothetical protein
LAEALDCDFTITTGGNIDWYTSTGASESYYDGDAVKSGSIDNNGQTWIQTTVTASAGDKASLSRLRMLGSLYGRFADGHNWMHTTSTSRVANPAFNR